MKKILCIFALLFAVPLTACAELTPVPTSPGAVAGRTVVDEQAAISVELAYKTFRLATEVAVDAGLVKGKLATCLAEVDNKAYAGVVTVRQGYSTLNATDYAEAIASANATITRGNTFLSARSC